MLPLLSDSIAESVSSVGIEKSDAWLGLGGIEAVGVDKGLGKIYTADSSKVAGFSLNVPFAGKGWSREVWCRGGVKYWAMIFLVMAVV